MNASSVSPKMSSKSKPSPSSCFRRRVLVIDALVACDVLFSSNAVFVILKLAADANTFSNSSSVETIEVEDAEAEEKAFPEDAVPPLVFPKPKRITLGCSFIAFDNESRTSLVSIILLSVTDVRDLLRPAVEDSEGS